MQFPVGVALKDLANFAAGQVTRAVGQQKFCPILRICFIFIFFLRGVAATEVGVIKICSFKS